MDPHQGDLTHNHATLQVITPHRQIQQTFSAGTHVEEESALFYTDIEFLEKRRYQWKAGKQGRDNRIINNKLESSLNQFKKKCTLRM